MQLPSGLDIIARSKTSALPLSPEKSYRKSHGVYGSGDDIDHFEEQIFFYFDEIHFFCFFFSCVVHAFHVLFKKFLPNPRS